VDPTIWIGVPLLGALIGWVTNRIAVKMIFRPIRPVSVLGMRFQGLIGRRQSDLARSIGDVVSDHLLGHDDVIRAFEEMDLERLLENVMEKALARKVAELRRMPLVGGFLTDERVADLRRGIVEGVMRKREMIFEELEQAIERGLDVRAIVTEKVAAFPVERLEHLVLHVASRELRTIEVLGGALGLLIGLAQAALITWL